ncbi:hypothetical protein GCM10007352_38140 [Mucilaginibacter phyllosphaerae]|nr:hypothetical protein GCM10007352_38140 [Mucilaginibacter phyllosphaerae]
MDAPSSCPASSSITKEVGLLNNGLGKQSANQQHKASKIAVNIITFGFLKFCFIRDNINTAFYNP